MSNPLRNRPFAIWGFSVAGGVWLGFAASEGGFTGWILPLCCALAVLAAVLRLRGWRIGALGLAVGCLAMCLQHAGLSGAEPREGMVLGRIVEQPRQYSGQTMLILEEVTVSGQEVEGRVRLYVPSGGYSYGNWVQAEASLKEPSRRRNPGGMDARLNAWAKNVRLSGYAPKAVNLGGQGGARGLLLEVRGWMEGNLEGNLEADAAGVVKGMLFGDSGEMEESGLESFRKTGIAHVLAVSGLHVGVICGALYALLRRLRASRWTCTGLCALFLLAYCTMVGFTASISRASIMCLVSMAGGALGERSDPALLPGPGCRYYPPV